ncbi:GDSL-type esterase/lipase family protein [Kurthia zopfii]|uniref:GDSL-type esterase/lipase family protein n=1 Tax=Kurthia zopfii TaxID=1650 RepID=UPI000F6F0E75|nr:GDSL-type esterase/lipase family protein [Kurthia zopfii]VEI06470.1 multifunctional acyl-CoA thioesterase I and protease I and lysophospholipase L1 [Kurthia zopfii]
MNRKLTFSVGLNVLLIAILVFVFVNDKGSDQVKSQEKKTADVLRPEHYEQRSNLFSRLPITEKDIVMFGDSMILYNEWDEQFPNLHIVNRGIGGDTTAGLLRRLPDVTMGQPQKIVIMIGTNDLSLKVPQKKIIENYQLLITQIKEQTPKTKIILTTVLPFNEDIRSTKVENGQIMKLNEEIRNLAKQNNVLLVDLYDVFLKGHQLNKAYTSDGLHLNGEGYAIWQQKLAKVLEEK